MTERKDFYFFENMSREVSVKHFVSTKKWGSTALHTGDDPVSVLAHREKISEAVSLPLEGMVFMNQVHGKKIAVISEKQKGCGAKDMKGEIVETDAMITNVPDIALVTQVADCVPILLYDPVQKAVGAVHAGWRGTVARIVQETLRALEREYGSKPEDILTGIGPAIQACCYRVGRDVRDAVKETGVRGLLEKNGEMVFNGKGSNRAQLLEMGVPEKNIEISDICTACRSDVCFSYRKEGKKSGRFMAGIMIKR